MTGDQIYAEQIYSNRDARVGIGCLARPDRQDLGRQCRRAAARSSSPTRNGRCTVSFPADRTHFPAGRRARLGTRAAGLTSEDTQNHALSIRRDRRCTICCRGRTCIEKLATSRRRSDVEELSTSSAARSCATLPHDLASLVREGAPRRWRHEALASRRIQRVHQGRPSMRGSGFLDGWRLLPPSPSRGIDQFAVAAVPDWNAPASLNWLDVCENLATAPEAGGTRKPSVRRRRSRRAHSSAAPPDDLRDLRKPDDAGLVRSRSAALHPIEHDYGVGMTSQAATHQRRRPRAHLRRGAGTAERGSRSSTRAYRSYGGHSRTVSTLMMCDDSMR